MRTVRKNPLLWYATRFQKPSVLKTGFPGTGVIFGTGNALLRYGADIRVRRTGSWGTECVFRGIRCKKQAPVVRGAFSCFTIKTRHKHLKNYK